MTDEQFILILKSRLKQYYLEGKSVGLELRALVAQFRQEIEDDALQFKYKETNENKNKHRSRNPVHTAPDRPE